jgi:tetratricopeptide (TPR) repeat protein
MHEVVRHYAAAQLAADPDEECTTRDQHGHYYAAWLVERETPLMKSAHQTAVLEEFRFEIDNLRSAWDWLFVQRTTPMPWRAINCFGYFLEVRCWYQEQIMMHQRAVAALEPTARASDTATPAHEGVTVALGTLMGGQGLFLCRIGQNNEGQALLRRSSALLRTQPDKAPLFYPLMFLGYVLTATGAYSEAQHLLEESLHIARAVGDTWCSALALMVLGQVAHAEGRLQEAHDLLQEGQALMRTMGEPRTLGMCLTELSAVLLALERYDEAHPALQESLALSNATGNRMDRGEALAVLGRAVWAQKQDVEATDLLDESLALSEEIGYARGIAQAHLDLGAIAYAQGEHGAARQHWDAALHTAGVAHLVPSALDALSHVAVLLADDGAAAQALELCAYIRHHPAARYETRARAAQIAAHQRAFLPPEQAAAAEERGQAGSLEAAIAAVQNTN